MKMCNWLHSVANWNWSSWSNSE